MEKIEKYNKKTVWIHWVTALLIGASIVTGMNMKEAEHDLGKLTLYRLHFSVGFSIFILTIIRVVVLFKSVKPQALKVKPSHQFLISFVHYGFYFVLLWMSISGIASLFLQGILPALKSGLLIDLPKINDGNIHPIMLSHKIIAKFVLVLLIFHVGGVIMHFLKKKENTLKRIWF